MINFRLKEVYLLKLQRKDFVVIHTLGDSGDFKTSRYQGIVKAAVFYRLQNLKFKISEGSDQN